MHFSASFTDMLCTEHLLTLYYCCQNNNKITSIFKNHIKVANVNVSQTTVSKPTYIPWSSFRIYEDQNDTVKIPQISRTENSVSTNKNHLHLK